MRDCTGEEILMELLYHLHMLDKADEIKNDIVNVIPCMMPYIDSQFQPRKMSDRPKVVPDGSTNFAMISQFVEIPEDMVFTEEYSVRAARIAVYTLFDVKNKKICPVTPYKKNPKVLKEALKTSYRQKNISNILIYKFKTVDIIILNINCFILYNILRKNIIKK